MRVLVYEDFTASGRALRFVDNYVTEIMKLYANTHTEINATGSATSQCFEKVLTDTFSHLKRLLKSFVTMFMLLRTILFFLLELESPEL